MAGCTLAALILSLAHNLMAGGSAQACCYTWRANYGVPMPGLLPDVDPDGLLEFSVVYTDRALNHMSKRFVGVMQDILATLKSVYGAQTAVLVPGSGTFGMEAVARQFANREKVLIVRNGFFSYRWSQIFDMGALGGGAVVCQARQQGVGAQAPWAPCPAEEVAAAIRAEKPKIVFAPHVETASGYHSSRQLPSDGRCCRTRSGRLVRAGLHRLRRRVGGYARQQRGHTDLRATEGLEQLALLRDGDAG